MLLSREDLAQAAVSGFHILNEAAPVVSPLEIPGVEGRSTRVSHPFPNMVTLASLDEAEADAVIQQVIDRFAAEGKSFSWIVGPDSAPADLSARLEAAGLEKAEVWSGLALTDLDRPLPSPPTVQVEEVGIDELHEWTAELAEALGFGVDVEVAELMLDIVEALQDRYGSRGYVAFADDSDAPIAFAIMTGTPRPEVMNLALAATLAEHRGKGAYRSVMARRLSDARAAGAAAVVAQANSETSAPILKKLGFAEVCSIDMYAWFPPS
jgi:hypothetical protein